MNTDKKNRARIAAQKLNAAANADEKKAAVEYLAREWDLSARSVYRAARAGGWESGRRSRTDKGESRMQPTDIQTVIKMKVASKRKSRRLIMDTPTALEIMEDSGKVVVSASRFNALMRASRSTNCQLQHDIDAGPHINLRSLHPNHCHQFDITNCIQYFFDDKGLGHRDMKKEFYIGKPDSFKTIKKKLLRFMIVDHYSGSFFCQYRYASGERSIDVAEFLLEAWRAKPNPEKYPFRGVPELLVCDRGSAAMSGMVSDMLEALLIKRSTHLPGNPRAKGSVETMMNFWEMKFESRLSSMPAPDLETLNAWALDYCVRANEKPLSRAEDGRSRSQLFLDLPSARLRLLPPLQVCQELLHTRPEERTVRGNLTISFKGSLFRVPDPNLEGRKVTVTINPYRWVVGDNFQRADSSQAFRRAVDVIWVDTEGERHKYEAREVMVNEAGFMTGERTAIIGREYDRHPFTETQKIISEIEKDDSSIADDLKIMGHHAEKVSAISFLSDKNAGETIEIEAEQPVISKEEALLGIRKGLGRALTEEEALEVEDLDASKITRDTVRAIVEKFLTTETQREEENTG